VSTEPEVLECNICFTLIQRESIEKHRYWHRMSGSPMGLQLYLSQFNIDGEP
jgi:hypothetical protein